ncbi:MAG: outer membrane protein transport protein [Myxococcales bacterium]|nr:outer membrane protein transport protein [Myxococcales bacterium]
MWTALTVLTLCISQAHAGGFVVARFGGEHGHVTTDNATAMYYNPAGISLRAGTHLYLDGTFAWRSFTYDRDPAAIDNVIADGETSVGTRADQIAQNSGEGGLFNFAAAPFAGVVTDFGVPNLGVGLSFYAPFGGASVYDTKDEYKGTPAFDGSQRWWAIEGTIRTLYVTGAVAYTIPKLNLSLGVGLNFARSEVHTIRARNATGHDHMTDAEGNPVEGRAIVDVSGNEFALGGGLIWKPVDNVWLGASYQSAPNFGESVLAGTATLVQGRGVYAGGVPEEPDVELKQSLPDIFRLGGRWRPVDVAEIRLFGELQRWSSFDKQCIIDTSKDQKCDGSTGTVALLPRDWEDSFGVRAGGSYWISPDIELYVGAGFDMSAVPDDTLEAGLYDTDKGTASLGGRFTLLDGALAISATYTQVFYADREIKPRGHVQKGAGTPVDESAAQNDPIETETDINRFGFATNERNPDSAGTYKQAVGVFNLNVEYNF